MRLIKESGVHAGDHQLTLNISDSQGQYSVQTLSLLVCDCDVSANCKDPTTKMNVTAIAVTIISIPMLLGKSVISCQAQSWVSHSVSRNACLVHPNIIFCKLPLHYITGGCILISRICQINYKLYMNQYTLLTKSLGR